MSRPPLSALFLNCLDSPLSWYIARRKQCSAILRTNATKCHWIIFFSSHFLHLAFKYVMLSHIYCACIFLVLPLLNDRPLKITLTDCELDPGLAKIGGTITE